MKSSEELVEIGISFLDTGKIPESIGYFDKALALNPGSSTAYEHSAIARYSQLDIEGALQDLDMAIRLDTTNHKALCNRAAIYMEKGNHDLAIPDLEQALDIAPENVSYKESLALCSLVKKDFQKTIGFCDAALLQSPVNYDALWYKAAALTDLKRYSEAIECYKDLFEHYAPSAPLYNGLAFCQIYYGDLKNAKINFRHAIRLDETYAYAWDNLGYIFYLEKNYSEALKQINHSILLDPSNSWAYKNRALVYLAIDNKPEAKDDLLHALELGYSREYDSETEDLLAKEFHYR